MDARTGNPVTRFPSHRSCSALNKLALAGAVCQSQFMSRYELDGSDRAMKTPILASMFNVAGAIVTLVTMLAVLSSVSQGEKLASIPVALIVGGTGGLAALGFFGTAQ